MWTRNVWRLALFSLVSLWVSSVVIHAQMGMGQLDVYKAAEQAFKAAAAASPANADCYLAHARLEACRQAELMGRTGACGSYSPCSITSMGGRVVPAPQLARGVGRVTGGGNSSGGALGWIADHHAEIVQGIEVARNVFRMFSNLRKRQREERQRQPLQRGDPRAEREVLHMQETARMLARQRTEAERLADLLLARADNTLSSADALLASADAVMQNLPAGSTAARSAVAPVGSAGTTSSAPSAGAPGSGAEARTAVSSSRSTAGEPHNAIASGIGCATGWADETFVVSAYGNDDLWLRSGALAFVTDERGRASTVGRFLSIENASAGSTHVSFSIAGSPFARLAPGSSTSVAAVPAVDGTLAIRVLYCKG